MNKIIDVTGAKGGNAFLVLGNNKAALLDCGMSYCAAALITNIKKVIGKQPLDYILLSHSHYDHVGAVPYLKNEWPSSKVFGSEHCKLILNKPSALKMIRELSVKAAPLFGAYKIEQYDDDMMKVDDIIYDGDIIDLGDTYIEVIETQGHTKCYLSFLIDKETLFASESTGCMSRDGKLHPSFLTGYLKAIASIHRCQAMNPQFIITPHFGLVSERHASKYWQKCLLAIEETKKFILFLSEQGYDEVQILDQYVKNFYDYQIGSEQPLNAFSLNAQSMIKTVLREAKPS